MSYEQGLTTKTFASLRFSGELLDPQVLTNLLKLDPTRSCHRGEHLPGSGRASERVSQEGWWLLRTKKLTRSKDLKDHTDQLLLLLVSDADVASTVMGLVQKHGVKLWINLFWFGGSGAVYPEVDSRFVDVISQLGGEIDTDFHRQSRESSKPEAA